MKNLKIGGEERPLCFNFNCLEEFEERTGIGSLNNLIITPKTAKVFIFCGLKYGLHPEGCDDKDLPFTIAKVGSWLDADILVEVMKVFNNQSAPEEKKSKKSDLSPNQ